MALLLAMKPPAPLRPRRGQTPAAPPAPPCRSSALAALDSCATHSTSPTVVRSTDPSSPALAARCCVAPAQEPRRGQNPIGIARVPVRARPPVPVAPASRLRHQDELKVPGNLPAVHEIPLQNDTAPGQHNTTGLLKGDLGQQVVQGAEAVKMMALYFHKQEMESRAQDERQLNSYTG